VIWITCSAVLSACSFFGAFARLWSSFMSSSLPLPPCVNSFGNSGGACTYWVVGVHLYQLGAPDGSPCFSESPGYPYANPDCLGYGLPQIINRCGGDTGCVNYYTTSYQLGLSVPDTVYVAETSGSSFDWDYVNHGFRDAFFVFLFIFAVYAVVKVLSLSSKP
jgi:hypothetical protein